MRFEEAFQGWTGGQLTQGEAAMLLGQCERSFRRHVERYEADGLVGAGGAAGQAAEPDLQAPGAAAPKSIRSSKRTRAAFAGWNVAHFHSQYRGELQGARSYSWVKTVLQGAGLVRTAKRRGKHRIKRERAPLPGMMVHQNASTHRWVADAVWDLVVTMDDATGQHTSMFFRAGVPPTTPPARPPRPGRISAQPLDGRRWTSGLARGRQTRFGLRSSTLCRPRTIRQSKRTHYLLPNRTNLFAGDRESPFLAGAGLG